MTVSSNRQKLPVRILQSVLLQLICFCVCSILSLQLVTADGQNILSVSTSVIRQPVYCCEIIQLRLWHQQLRQCLVNNFWKYFWRYFLCYKLLIVVTVVGRVQSWRTLDVRCFQATMLTISSNGYLSMIFDLICSKFSFCHFLNYNFKTQSAAFPGKFVIHISWSNSELYSFKLNVCGNFLKLKPSI